MTSTSEKNHELDSLFAAATHFHQQGDLPSAIANYQRVLELNPNLAEVHNNLGTIFYQLHDFQQAIKHYAMAVNLEPAYAEAHYNLGLLFLKANKLPEAIKQFNNVIALYPDHVAAKKYLADLYLLHEQLVEAKQLYQEILPFEPENVAALNNLGVTFLKLNDHQSAADYFTKVLSIDEHHLDARNNLAAIYLQNNRYDNAVTHYLTLLKQTPEDVDVHYNLAVAQMAIGQLNSAAENFSFVLSKQPDHVDSLCNLAAIKIKLGHTDQAIAYYQRAKHIKPDDALINYMLSALTHEQLLEQAPPKYVTNLFDNYAGYYDKHVKEVLHYKVPELLQAAINKILLTEPYCNLPTKLNVLDLGCGTGLSGQMIRAQAGNLVGVDLAQKMLNLAQTKNCYDELICSDIHDFFANTASEFDLILAADVLVYFGDLSSLFSDVKHHLSSNGLFAFTVEAMTDKENGDYVLRETARFAHNKDYIIALAKQLNFSVLCCETITPRFQDGQPLLGYLVVLGNSILAPL